MNDRSRGINIHEGSDICTMGMHGETTMANSIMDIAGTWCNQFGKKHQKATLKEVQYKPNFNLFSIRKVIKEGWKLIGD